MTARAGRVDRWAIILAGGEGLRLRGLTRQISGDERPKQFCPLLGSETLLDRTRRRVGLSVSGERMRLVLTRAHERFYAPLVADLPRESLIVQPWARGTAPAVLYGLLTIAAEAPDGTVGLFASDHYVSDDVRFMAHVGAAFAAVEARPDLVVLLGIEAAAAEVQYGWIEPGDLLPGEPSYPIHRVRRFWEKPAPPIAERLLRQGCLWNSFVLVARAARLLALTQMAAPHLHAAFLAAWHGRAAEGEDEAMRRLYAGLAPTDLSADVLARRPTDLSVLPVRGVSWSDWGEPARVLRTLAGLGLRPRWLEWPGRAASAEGAGMGSGPGTPVRALGLARGLATTPAGPILPDDFWPSDRSDRLATTR